LKQIAGYMWCNGFKYGVLTTYNQTWFIRCTSHQESHDIEISPTIYFNQNNPTLLQCYLWFIRQSHNDEYRRLIPPSEYDLNDVCDAKGDDSDYQPPPHDESERKNQEKGFRRKLLGVFIPHRYVIRYCI